ncbi:TonB-dependent receptor [Sphingomonas sp. GC_Shp_3]|uniref:TonB-dependent receptor n=1 Tax=Sphingomonas sp. GC_Shp_3 TaxID=2937383 RepID=UPI002269BCC3|nr:TonB-dependent receptor [Sphingomonas sp. GC_Shp_3]
MMNRVMEAFAVSSLLVAGQAAAQETDPTRDERQDARGDGDIVVYGRALPQIGTAKSGSEGTVGYEDFANRPVSRVGELAENVPGLIATQHSGTGKANQYFLRGFNLDHGTDLAGYADGVPINMRSHGHGQGYLDLNFLIPELVERIDYAKGPYSAEAGDFSAAGTVRFKTTDALPHPIAEATVGSYGYARALAAGSRAVGDGTLLLGLDGTASNGPWVLDENLRKINALAKYSRGTDASGWSMKVSGYHATWNSTDQVPLRSIESGAISRYGYIDPDLGGRTTRLDLTGEWHDGGTRGSAYATYYDFGLTSNFTYFLNDPVNGDQFQQADRRGIFGGSLRHAFNETKLLGLPATVTVGVDLRYDLIGKVGLYTSTAGVRTGTVRQDRVDEASGNIWAEVETKLTPSLRLTLGANAALYGYDVRSSLGANSGSGSDALLAPKAALAWRVASQLELYANYGESYHSNDARGATTTIDPATGAATDPVQLLVRARGQEIGARIETGAISVTLVAYHLTLGSELVFVGDAGITEPNAASRRYGTEATLFWRVAPTLVLDAQGALTNARFRGVASGESRIPNSVANVLSGGATWTPVPALSLTARLRHFGAAPLVEDNSARSNPTTLVNAGGYFTIGHVRLGLDLLNVFNSRDADITYYYASRLPGEPSEGVEDYHLHPVEPRQVRASLRYSF